MPDEMFSPWRVLCVDDNELVASALQRRMQKEPLLRWSGVVSDGSAVLQTVRDVSPDIVLMDIDMPGVDSFTLVERLAAESPDVRVLMFSGHVTSEYIDRALNCGAWGYLSKNEDVAELLQGVLKAARGEIALSREATAVQRSAFRRSGHPTHPGDEAG